MQITSPNPAGQVVTKSDQLVRKPPEFTVIGKGRSAFVFRDERSHHAVKVFFDQFADLAKQEGDIYKKLGDCSYFPNIHEVGPNYIVMEYIEGNTFYECLQKGIPITDEMIKEVDEALDFARSVGLNPSDIHLRNLILTNEGMVKVIDVVRFTQNKKCRQWDDLKRGYHRYYKKSFLKKIPKSIIELVALYYKKVVVPFRAKEMTE
ncbi:protein kinase family protein [Pseudalkalibacillus salsuginis]|uniref:protein kinase family protein n=1 Tax=Pseudalkalibacillus salsuginis TaxID=2910972 RepID=UPI001F23F20C|nr:protein kinase family protein [Pseudalkalibacillus salsuginis]MCF6410336.1 protein kinase family protein [Pseudalkalibacillus salsuginis]